MYDLKCLLVGLSLILFLGNVSALCIVHKNLLATKNIYLTNNNGIFDIQHSDIVANGQSIYLLCNGGVEPTKFQCQSDNNFDPPLNTVMCSAPFEPSVVNVPDTSCPSPFLTYAVGYHVSGRFMELYRNCFDAQHLALQHSIYKVYRHENTAPRPNSPWNSDGISGGFDSAYEGKATQACLQTNLGAKQPQCRFDRGHMTPASAFMFTELKRTTFRYLNAIPQYAGVNRGYWRTIEGWVNSLVMGRNYDVLKVCTGALGVHRLKHKNSNKFISIFLLDNDKIPVPEWMYKIVSHLSGDKWVILTYNDFNEPSQQALDQMLCQPVNCHPNLHPNKRGVGYTVCCEPYDFITRNVPHLTGVC
ncbi:uncharacterized protein LOC119561448 [Drosophila subpulchrella]|uniref:uncharacterized protein LOC119561448 n=1 Tax=Drosophila subpulchrella TaxID=1486046 RepID=UPI0018A16975|nr:uncharacterized protein LOC119561448 [Drosophila subpulchrella]